MTFILISGPPGYSCMHAHGNTAFGRDSVQCHLRSVDTYFGLQTQLCSGFVVEHIKMTLKV